MTTDRNLIVEPNAGLAARPPAHEPRQVALPDYGQPGYGYGVGGTERDEDSFDVFQLFVYVLRYRWLIAGALIAGMAAAVAVTLVMTPKYQARALLEVAAPSARVIQDLQAVAEQPDIRTFNTALQKLQSREMMQRVVSELGLSERGSFIDPPGFSLANLIDRAKGGKGDSALKRWSAREREQKAINNLRNGLAAALLKGTSLIAVTFSGSDPDLARQIANQFAASYSALRLDQTSQTSDVARQFMVEQVSSIKKKLEEAERALVQYAKGQGITVTGEEGSLVAANLRAINEALSKAIQERLANERVVAQLDAGQATRIEQVLANDSVQKHRGRIAELKGIYRQKLSKFKPKFPEMLELASQIRELETLLKADIEAIANGIRLNYQGSIRKERDLRKKLAELEAKQAAYQDKFIRYTILKREVDSYRSQYKSLIDKLNDLGVSSEIKNKSATIVEYAITPTSPYSPSLPKNLLISLGLVLVLTGGGIYTLEALNNTFSSPDQIESELKVPLFGILPHVEEKALPEAITDPQSALSEAFRTLRTSIQFAGINGAPRSLLVTSTEPGEGKSNVARKLAEEFGALGLNVLIVDADMRKPMQRRLAGVPNSLGLSNLLTNTVPVEKSREEVEVMRNTPWPNVWLVTAGTLPPNPANLLASQKMGLFIEACSNRFDLVIIDAPPVIGLADALLLSRIAESVLLVVSAHQVHRKAAMVALKKLKNAGGHVVGAAFNKFKLDRMEYNYAYRYMDYGYIANDGDEDGEGIEDGRHDKLAGSPKPSSLVRLPQSRSGDTGERGQRNS